MNLERKLIPIMREGIDVIKMIFFKKLQDRQRDKKPMAEAAHVNILCGAVLNELFGTPNTQEPFKSFADANRAAIDKELRAISENFPEFRIPLTDALRMQFLCDSSEGNDNTDILIRADELGILIKERDVPLPKNFLELVRRLGSSFGLIIRPPAADGGQ